MAVQRLLVGSFWLQAKDLSVISKRPFGYKQKIFWLQAKDLLAISKRPFGYKQKPLLNN